ncbi:54S ribosomal protein L23, mitochondrial [Tulasnella sp. 330]|nr:54S ribosomal protein L23, mitochondrial [Tulasnella sp. 330]KAG8875352.1 54S ribosomal protein L23, mitochondrial [Tulasnella sp. 331]KAG8879840.1 54S ribosomal protein L23, mitochondrial [Tulasnella sp. 332]
MSQAVGNTALAYARVWHDVDASNRVLGKLAQRIAIVLMGKHKPIYDPGVDCGDYVTVTNAKKVVVTGRKADQKMYIHHTMWPGGLKEIPYKTMMDRKPDEIIRKAVSGMLPKNKLRDKRLSRLRIFYDEKNPFEGNVLKRWEDGQTPGPLPPPRLGFYKHQITRTR